VTTPVSVRNHREIVFTPLHAAVESMSCLDDFIQMFAKSEHHPILILLVTHTVTRGVSNKTWQPNAKGHQKFQKKVDVKWGE